MNIVMYLFADPSHDGRVIREAGSLAAAGHQVTLMARLHADRRTTPPQIPGVRIVDVPSPAIVWFVVTTLRRPWRLGRWVAASLQGLWTPRPRSLARAIGALILAPWVAAGTAWRRLRHGQEAGPPVRKQDEGLLDYLLFWVLPVWAWGRSASAAGPSADVHHAHDLSALPAAIRAAGRGGSVVYDSHEVFVESGRHARRGRRVRRILGEWERRMARQAAAVVTVNDGVAAELSERLNPRRMVTVHNCPPRWAPPADPSVGVRSRLGLDSDVPVALYHGGFAPHRGLEVLAAAIREPGMGRVHAVYLGFGPERPAVDALAADPRTAGRVHVLDAVNPSVVVDTVAGADVAVMAIEGTTRNHLLSTPNKLFEALAAGVPVVVSDFPGMRRIVLGNPDGPLGAVCDPASSSSVAAAIREILDQAPDQITAMRSRCRRAADTRWNWETEATGLLALYAELGAEAERGADAERLPEHGPV